MRALVVMLLMVVATNAYAGKPEADLRKLVDTKIQWMKEDADLDEWFASGGDGFAVVKYGQTGAIKPEELIVGGPEITKHSVTSFAARVAPDGRSAIVSYLISIKYLVTMDEGGMYDTVAYRVTEASTKTKDGWRVVGGIWTEAEPNAEANKNAKAGTLKLATIAGGGDASLTAAFTKLTTDGFDEAATKRKDLVAIGSGPKERTVGGAGLAKAWKGGWANKLDVDAARGVLLSPTLGYVLADVKLAKTGYKIPFRLLIAFERKTEADAWSVVHAHFAVPAKR